MMKFGAFAVLAVLAAAIMSQIEVPARAQTSTPTETVDLMELMGIRLPEGDALEKLVADAARHPLGSQLNPVRVSGPGGQRAYLGRLRCSDGKPSEFQRAGAAGIGAFGRIVDSYAVRCDAERRQVFLDMYHSGHVENRPIAGFAIVATDPRPVV